MILQADKAACDNAVPLEPPEGAYVVSARAASNPERPLRLSLVIPTHNESRSLRALIQRLSELLDPVLGEDYELVVVDDDSADRTWALALELAASQPRLRVVRRTREKGLSTAVIRGWQIARGDVLGVMDADFQHPPELNAALFEAIERGADLAVGSRHSEGGGVSDWSILRRLLSRGAQLLGLLILPSVLGRLTDPMSGYFMVRRSAIAGIALNPVGYKILIEVVARSRPRWIAEVGYVFRERIAGESKVTARIYFQYLEHLLRLRLATLRQSRFLRFCVVGVSGVLVDMSLLYLLSDPSTLALGLTRSKLIAGGVAMTTNFLLNDWWTFGDVAGRIRSWAGKGRRLVAFHGICLLGLVLNVLILNLLFNLAGLDRYVANAVAIGAVTAWNYLLNSRLNWAPMVIGSEEPPGPVTECRSGSRKRTA